MRPQTRGRALSLRSRSRMMLRFCSRAAKGASALTVVLAVVAAWTDLPGHWLVLEGPAEPADAAIVLAGDPGYERTTAAVRLFMTREVRLLLLTGGEPGPGDSADSLRDVALALGVPPDRIRAERLSHTTHEAMVALQPIISAEGIGSVVVVTSPYHARRATWAARRTLRNVRVISHPARPSEWRPDGWWKTSRSRRIVFREYAKLVYYGLRGWI